MEKWHEQKPEQIRPSELDAEYGSQHFWKILHGNGVFSSAGRKKRKERIKRVLPKMTSSIFRPCRIYGSEEKRSLCENQKRLYRFFFFLIAFIKYYSKPSSMNNYGNNSGITQHIKSLLKAFLWKKLILKFMFCSENGCPCISYVICELMNCTVQAKNFSWNVDESGVKWRK